MEYDHFTKIMDDFMTHESRRSQTNLDDLARRDRTAYTIIRCAKLWSKAFGTSEAPMVRGGRSVLQYVFFIFREYAAIFTICNST